MNQDLLMRSDLLVIVTLFHFSGLSAQEEVTSTLVDEVATLDMAVVASEQGARPVIIREEVAQQIVIPSVVTKTIPLDDEARQIRQLPSVDTISGAEIRTYQRFGLEDVLRQSAGVSLVQAGQAGGQTSLFVRGMESNHTVVLLNGRRLPPGLAGLYQLEYLDVSTLESVQFTRGAASSLYGSDAIAGAIDLRSTDARYVESNTLSSYVEGGSFSTFRNGHKITLRDGAVGMAIDAGTHRTANDRPASDFENRYFRGNVAVDLGGGVQFDLLGSVQDSFLEVPGSSLSPAFPEPQINRNDSALLSPRLTIVQDDWDFSVFYSYSNNELTATRDLFFNDNRLDQTGHETEAIFNFHPTDEATWTIGGGHYSQEFERIALIPGPFNPDAAFEFAYSGIFAQADLELPADFHLLASGRYDDHDSFASKGTYSVQLSKRIEPTGTTVFGKIATGYKAPSGQDFIFLAPGVDPTLIDPEESQTWELGLSQEIFNERSSIALTWFQSDIENLIDVDPLTFANPAIVDTDTQGIEVELVYSPCEGLSFYTNYTWLDAIVVDGQYLGGFGGAPGDRLPRRPEHTLSAGLVLSGDDWKAGVEVSGAYDRLDSPGVFLDDYTVARIFGSRELNDRVEIYGRLENAFDLDYQTTTGFEAAGFGTFGGVRIVFGE
jgi:vitamin B12 transporter